MPKIFPFRAVRPTRDKIALVATRSYQSYLPDERNARMKSNPFSFLHIVNPGYKYQKEISGKARFQLVKNRYQEFKEEGVFIQDENPSFYIYKIVDPDNHTFLGIIASISTEAYEENGIKKHEETLEEKEEIFTEYLHTVRFNAEPILITYPDCEHISKLIENEIQGRAEYEFTTTFRDTHYLWKIDNPETVGLFQEYFKKTPSLYIADGHHRCASSYLLQQKLKKENPHHSPDESYNFLMCYLLSESQVKIHEFNRLIKDLNGLTKEEFLIQLDADFKIENKGSVYYKPGSAHDFSMYLDGDFYKLTLRKKNYGFENALESLDAHILYKYILHPILGLEDLRSDDRIEYVHGKSDLTYLKTKIDRGECMVGFGLTPATIQELKSISDQGLTMPPKSTFIEPKLRSGITIYEF